MPPPLIPAQGLWLEGHFCPYDPSLSFLSLPPYSLTCLFPGLPISTLLSFPGTCYLPALWSSLALDQSLPSPSSAVPTACLLHQDSTDSDCPSCVSEPHRQAPSYTNPTSSPGFVSLCVGLSVAFSFISLFGSLSLAPFPLGLSWSESPVSWTMLWGRSRKAGVLRTERN